MKICNLNIDKWDYTEVGRIKLMYTQSEDEVIF